MAKETITIEIKNVGGEPTTTAFVTGSVAAQMLGCCRNTIKKHARDGRIRYLWACYGQPQQIQLLYRVDVLKLAEAKEEKLEMKLNQMKGKSCQKKPHPKQ